MLDSDTSFHLFLDRLFFLSSNVEPHGWGLPIASLSKTVPLLSPLLLLICFVLTREKIEVKKRNQDTDRKLCSMPTYGNTVWSDQAMPARHPRHSSHATCWGLFFALYLYFRPSDGRPFTNTRKFNQSTHLAWKSGRGEKRSEIVYMIEQERALWPLPRVCVYSRHDSNHHGVKISQGILAYREKHMCS